MPDDIRVPLRRRYYCVKVALTYFVHRFFQLAFDFWLTLRRLIVIQVTCLRDFPARHTPYSGKIPSTNDSGLCSLLLVLYSTDAGDAIDRANLASIE
jgi:hypothetical protein